MTGAMEYFIKGMLLILIQTTLVPDASAVTCRTLADCLVFRQEPCRPDGSRRVCIRFRSSTCGMKTLTNSRSCIRGLPSDPAQQLDFDTDLCEDNYAGNQPLYFGFKHMAFPILSDVLAGGYDITGYQGTAQCSGFSNTCNVGGQELKISFQPINCALATPLPTTVCLCTTTTPGLTTEMHPPICTCTPTTTSGTTPTIRTTPVTITADTTTPTATTPTTTPMTTTPTTTQVFSTRLSTAIARGFTITKNVCICTEYQSRNGCVGECGVGEEVLVKTCFGNTCVKKEEFKTRPCALQKCANVRGVINSGTDERGIINRDKSEDGSGVDSGTDVKETREFSPPSRRRGKQRAGRGRCTNCANRARRRRPGRLAAQRNRRVRAGMRRKDRQSRSGQTGRA